MFWAVAKVFVTFFLAAGMNLVSYWFSDKIVLSMYGATEVSRNHAPELYDMVQDLARRAHESQPGSSPYADRHPVMGRLDASFFRPIPRQRKDSTLDRI